MLGCVNLRELIYIFLHLSPLDSGALGDLAVNHAASLSRPASDRVAIQRQNSAEEFASAAIVRRFIATTYRRAPSQRSMYKSTVNGVRSATGASVRLHAAVGLDSDRESVMIRHHSKLIIK